MRACLGYIANAAGVYGLFCLNPPFPLSSEKEKKIDERKRLRFLPCKNERERGLSISMHFPFTREQISPLEKREKIATRHARTFFSAKVMIMFGVSLFPYRMIGELSRCHHVSDQS